MTGESSRLIAIIVRGDPTVLTTWLADGERREIELVRVKNGVEGFEIVETALLHKLEADLKNALHERAILRGSIRARDWKRAKSAKAKTDMVTAEEELAIGNAGTEGAKGQEGDQ
jgi:hypothetical protein